MIDDYGHLNGLLDALGNPARRAKAAEEQAERRARMAHVTTRRPAEANYLFGLARCDHALALADAGDVPGAASVLAEGYALQGRFGEAAAVEPDAERRKEFGAKAAAVARAGSHTCDCPAETVTASRTDAKGHRSPTRSLVEEVFDGERFFNLFKCRACGALSAEVSG